MEKTESNVSLSELSPEAKKQLLQELRAEETEKRVKKAENTTAYKELSQEFVNNNVDIFVHRQSAIEKDIEQLFNDYQSILDIKAGVYGDKVKEQDTHTSTLPDGSASITIGYNVSIGFDGTEKIGIQGIKEFITTLTDDDENTAKLSAMVNVLLKESKKTGMLNPSNIVQLNSLREKLQSQEFNDNLDIIINAQIRVKSTMFVSGWKFITPENGIKKKLEFRFSI